MNILAAPVSNDWGVFVSKENFGQKKSAAMAAHSVSSSASVAAQLTEPAVEFLTQLIHPCFSRENASTCTSPLNAVPLRTIFTCALRARSLSLSTFVKHQNGNIAPGPVDHLLIKVFQPGWQYPSAPPGPFRHMRFSGIRSALPLIFISSGTCA